MSLTIRQESTMYCFGHIAIQKCTNSCLSSFIQYLVVIRPFSVIQDFFAKDITGSCHANRETVWRSVVISSNVY